jgi:hypothetical protein
MSDNGTIFSADNATTQTEDATQQSGSTQPSQSEIVAALVGEGKKYKTVDDLAKAYVHADDFIEQLKAENRQLKEQTVANKTIDDVLERLQQQQTTQPVDQQVTVKQPSVEDLTKLVEATVTGLETRKKREDNIRRADSRMKELFGEQAAAKFAEVAVTPELKRVYTDLASVDPDKFVALFVKEGKETTVAEMGGINTTVSYASVNNTGRTNKVGTKEYFDNVRRTSPSVYYSQDFQLQMDQAVRSNPSLYYGK